MKCSGSQSLFVLHHGLSDVRWGREDTTLVWTPCQGKRKPSVIQGQTSPETSEKPLRGKEVSIRQPPGENQKRIVAQRKIGSPTGNIIQKLQHQVSSLRTTKSRRVRLREIELQTKVTHRKRAAPSSRNLLESHRNHTTEKLWPRSGS